MVHLKPTKFAMITRRLSSCISYEDAVHARKTAVNPTWAPMFRKPLLIERGDMQYLWDHSGNKYLDMFAGIVTVSVGHCHPRLNEALKGQMDKLWHTTSIYVTSPVIRYTEKLLKTFPEHLNVCYLTNSGAEANELALLMARLHTGNFEMLALRNGYHGIASGVMGATNLATWKHAVPAGFGFIPVMNADPFRGPWGGSNCRDSLSQVDRLCSCKPGSCEASDKYVDQVEDVIRHCTPKQGLAGMFIESVQGAGGSVQYPRGFVKRAFEAVHNAGGVCISDEVQTGFGRLGDKFWGFQHHDAKPDIVTMAKGIGNGFPMAALVTTTEIAQSIGKALHFNTFGGNPLAATVGSAVLDEIEESDLMGNCRVVGDYLMHKLIELKAKHKCIGDVRGKGLFIGIEFINPKADKQNEALTIDEMLDVIELLKINGVLVGRGGLYGNVIRIKPPMCITKDNCDTFLQALTTALQQIGY